MDSSQFSYEAPGPSYESSDHGQPGAPAGSSRPPRPVPQNVPSLPSPLDPGAPVPSGAPGDSSDPPSPAGIQPVPAYPVPVSYPSYVAPLGHPGYPTYGGGAVGQPSSTGFPYPYPLLPAQVVVRHSLRRNSKADRGGRNIGVLDSQTAIAVEPVGLVAVPQAQRKK